MNNRAFLTLDSGGSKTALRLYTVDGVVIRESFSKGFGFAEESECVLADALSVLSEFCKGYQIVAAVCNLGGKNQKQMELTLNHVFPNAKIRVFRESEGSVGLEICREYSAEVMLMVGTGAIAIAGCGDKAVISGGWGANISDMGSGYQLGLDAVRISLEELDGVKELSLLAKTITGVSEPPTVMDAAKYCEFRDGVRRRLAPFDRAHIASLSKTVYSCARLGDEVALDLYKKVGSDLASLLISTAKKTGQGLSCAVVNGGMVNAREFWQESFEKKLENEYGSIKIHYLINGIDEAMRRMAEEIIKGE